MQDANHPPAVRIVLADDHELLRAGFTALLEQVPDVEVIGQAADGHELVKLAESLEPDIVFTDISMPKMDGLEAIERIKKTKPKVRCIVITMHTNVEVIRRAAAVGAVGYVMKDASARELQTAIDTVVSRGTYFSPGVAALLLAPAPAAPADLLSEREIEILRMLARGRSAKEIGFELDLSPKTVLSHRSHIMKRLGISDLAGLTRYALKHGLASL
jgi:DNA-binding NarL/FixJ family response regulator